MCKRRLQDVIRATRQKEASSLILKWKMDSLAWGLVLWKSLVELERCSVLTEQLEAAQSSAQRVLHQTATPEAWQSFEQWCVIHDVASDSVLQHEISLVRTECKLESIAASWNSPRILSSTMRSSHTAATSSDDRQRGTERAVKAANDLR